MPKYQIVEKDDFGTDWHVVRYSDASIKRFETEEDAVAAAKEYVHKTNDSSLCSSDRQSGAECFMQVKEGFFLGFKDAKKGAPREDWLAMDGRKNVLTKRSQELEGKTEVKVRPIPGT